MRRLLILGILTLVGSQAAAAQPPAASRSVRAIERNVRTVTPRILPGTRASAFTTIQGNALDSANGPLPDSLVRLRDARFGRIVASQWTDKLGLFAFGTVDPGSYVVELLGGNQQAVVGTSQLLNVAAGEAVSAIVKMPFRIPPFAGVLGHNVAQALTITSAAAAAGVLTTAVARDDVSPE